MDPVISRLKGSLGVLSDSAVRLEQKGDFRSLAALWEGTGNVHVAAHYLGLAARSAGSPEAWRKAGKAYLIAYTAGIDSARNPYFLSSARQAFENALEKDSTGTEDKISLAICLLESPGETMKGVKLLLQVVETDPENLDANLLLGKWGVFSGQYDKAILRLEKVVSLDTGNLEAHYQLGEAYLKTGDSVRANRMFEVCRQMVSGNNSK